LFTSKHASKARDLIAVLTEAKQQINPKLVQLQATARDTGKGRAEVFFFLLEYVKCPVQYDDGIVVHNNVYCLLNTR
jgi:hypothetical protein